MSRILELLQEKNHFLEKFFKLNEQELKKFNDGNFDDLEKFYHSRETILEMIKRLDSMVDEVQNVTNVDEISNQCKAEILKALSYKNEIVTQILSQDLQVLSVIESEKSGIIKELSQVQAARKALNVSDPQTTGENLDESY